MRRMHKSLTLILPNANRIDPLASTLRIRMMVSVTSCKKKMTTSMTTHSAGQMPYQINPVKTLTSMGTRRKSAMPSMRKPYASIGGSPAPKPLAAPPKPDSVHKPFRSGYETYKDPGNTTGLQVDPNLWGLLLLSRRRILDVLSLQLLVQRLRKR